MTTSSNTRAIVVGYDFSAPSDAALDRGLELALSQPGTQLHVLGVLDAAHGADHWRADGDSPLAGNAPDYDAARETHDEIKAVVNARLEAHHSPEVQVLVHARLGHPVEEILALAEETGAEMIVVGTHGRSRIRRWLLGSVAERLVRHAECSVLIARDHSYPQDTSEQFTPEPPCPDCARERKASNGRVWWCKQHSGHHLQPHIYGVPHEDATVGSYMWFQ